MRASGVLFWLVVAAIAVPAVVLTLNRLIDSDAGGAVRLMSFTGFATPLWLLEVLLLGVALAAGFGGARRVVAPLLVVAVAAAALHLWWVAPKFVGSNPEPAAGARPVVVMNLNMFVGHADGAEVMDLATARGVDVLVLEEITPEAREELEAVGVEEAYPYTVGWPSGVDGTMVFSRLQLHDAVQLDTAFQSWVVRVGEGDDALTLVAAHPRAPVDPGGIEQWRRENAEVLAAAQAHDADLVMGDLNATSDHKPLRELRAAGWRDSLELVNAGWSRTWPANGISPARGLHPPALIQIDHVLVGQRWAVTESDTVEIARTDHRAVLATVARR